MSLHKEIFFDICRSQIKREGIEDLLAWLEKSDFFTAPASSKFHGSYEGGLAEHSLNVYNCMKKVADAFPTEGISDENIAVCALFHDICKVNFYRLSERNVKDDATGKWIKKPFYEINEKFPIGHGEKSCIILQWFLRKVEVQELLAIRWHMGGFDCAAKGGDFSINKVYETYPLAVMLHVADVQATYLLEQ